MALRVLVVMMLLMSPMTSVSLALSQSSRGVVGTGTGACCPLCDAMGSMGCGCGCGVSEVPMPTTLDSEFAVLTQSERWEPIEHEITDIVALVERDEVTAVGGTLVELGGGADRGGGVQAFLATTGHWII